MPIETMVMTTYRIACHRCGKAQFKFHESVERAIEAAKINRGHHLKKGRLYPVWLCHECHLKK